MDALERLMSLSKAEVVAFRERRNRPRYGAMKEIEDITHRVLRANKVKPSVKQQSSESPKNVENKTASLNDLCRLAKAQMVQFPAKPQPKMKDYGSHFDSMWTRVGSTRPELEGVKEVSNDRDTVQNATPAKSGEVVPFKKKNKPDKIASMKNTDKKQASKSMNAFDVLTEVAKGHVQDPAALATFIGKDKLGDAEFKRKQEEGRRRNKGRKGSQNESEFERELEHQKSLDAFDRMEVMAESNDAALGKSWNRNCPQCKKPMNKPDLKTQSTCPGCGWKWGETASKAMSHTITPPVKKLPPGIARGAEFSARVSSRAGLLGGRVPKKPSMGQQEDRMKSASQDGNKPIKDMKVKGSNFKAKPMKPKVKTIKPPTVQDEPDFEEPETRQSEPRAPIWDIAGDD